MYIPRSLEEQLRSAVRQFPAVALTGPRQSGKSTLLRERFPDYRYVSFDDLLLREQATSDPNMLLDSLGEKGILDEIQYVPQLLSYVKMRIDAERDRRGRYILTGSQQFALTKGLGDSLAGRVGILNLLPFDIRERRRVPDLAEALETTEEAFVHACLRGAFPELCTHSEPDSRLWYASYLQTYLERDIRTLYDIGSLREFQQFLQLLAARCSQPLHMSALASEVGVAVTTIKRWVSVLEAGGIVYLLPPYYRNFGKRITKAPKVYFLDIGLVCYLTGVSTREILINGPLAGALFESFCVQETVKLLTHAGTPPRLYYLRTHNGLEVDLLIEGPGLCLHPVEIKLSKTPKASMASGIIRFRALFPQLDVRAGHILSLCDTPTPLTADVGVLPFDAYIELLEGL